MQHRAQMALTLAACFILPSEIFGANSDFDLETRLRIHHYTEPVPDHVPGGRVVDTQGVKRLIDTMDVILVDVLSISGVRYDEIDGSWAGYEPRYNLPGSLWLPNVGYGRPSEDMLKYFIDTVGNAVLGDLSRPILVYCVSDCWMGWNAVQHLARAGFSNVYWSPQGTDGWTEAGYEVVLTKPTPVNVDF